jgi:DNA polymerase-3 subunit delta'
MSEMGTAALQKIIGQPQAVNILMRAIAQNKLAPAYLFTGVAGVGKRTTARALIQTIKGKVAHPDVLWVAPTYLDRGRLLTAKEAEEAGVKRKTSPQVRIEQIREVADFLSRPPLFGERSLVVIEAAETMAESASNALLKTLEEPGKGTIILLAPTPASLLPTLVSRCQKVPFYSLSLMDMRAILQGLGVTELPENLLLQAGGSVGKALQAQKQLQTIPPELLPSAENLPRTAIAAMQLAKSISQLEMEAQMWLADYWQSWLWHQYTHPATVSILEQTKQHLQDFVQPRLAWEVGLSSLVNLV